MWQLSADAPAARLDVDVLRRLGEYSDVQTWPVVLDLWPTHADGDDLDAVDIDAHVVPSWSGVTDELRDFAAEVLVVERGRPGDRWWS